MLDYFRSSRYSWTNGGKTLQEDFWRGRALPRVGIMYARKYSIFVLLQERENWKKKSSSGRRLPTDFLPARNKPRRTKFLLRSLVIPEESNMPVIPVFCYFRQHVARNLKLITIASATTQFIFISLTKGEIYNAYYTLSGASYAESLTKILKLFRPFI